MPSDGQLIASALTLGLPALGALIRSAAIIWRDAKIETAKQWQDSNTMLRDALKDSNAVIRENSAAFAQLMQALGVVDTRTQGTAERMVEIHREISDVHTVPVTAQSVIVSEEVAFDDAGDTPVEIPAQAPRVQTRERDPSYQSPALGTPRIATPPIGVPQIAQGGPTQPRAQSQPFVIVKKRGSKKGGS